VTALCAVPFIVDGYKLAIYLNEFFGLFCDLTQPVVNTTTISWAVNLRSNASAIHDEFLEFERTHEGIPRISQVSSGQTYLDYHPKYAWRSLFLRIYGRNTIHFDSFPLLASLIAQVPDVSMVMISILDPHYEGSPHVGVYRGIHRYLMGLEVRSSFRSHDSFSPVAFVISLCSLSLFPCALSFFLEFMPGSTSRILPAHYSRQAARVWCW
jgi:hypothetical protein